MTKEEVLTELESKHAESDKEACNAVYMLGLEVWMAAKNAGPVQTVHPHQECIQKVRAAVNKRDRLKDAIEHVKEIKEPATGEASDGRG